MAIPRRLKAVLKALLYMDPDTTVAVSGPIFQICAVENQFGTGSAQAVSGACGSV